MILLQTVLLPEAVPPATPIKKGEGRLAPALGSPLLEGLGVREAKVEPFNFVGEEGGVKGGLPSMIDQLLLA